MSTTKKTLTCIICPLGCELNVELDVYAYALAETITYGNGGSYHISSFVSGSEGQPHEALVKAFAKYVESAEAYRNSVVNK